MARLETVHEVPHGDTTARIRVEIVDNDLDFQVETSGYTLGLDHAELQELFKLVRRTHDILARGLRAQS